MSKTFTTQEERLMQQYAINAPIKVVDRRSDLYDQQGNVVRHGFAGEVMYVHVKLPDHLTVITFLPSQLKIL